MTKRKPKRAAAVAIAVVLASASAFLTIDPSAQFATFSEHPQRASPRRHLLDGVDARSDAPPPNAERPFDPDAYAYLIVHYHKTGNHLSRQLRDFLVRAGESAGGRGTPRLDGQHNAFRRRMHEEGTGCHKKLKRLSPGVVAVQSAPDFFCDAETFAEYLLRNDDAFRDKRGVKVVHLVRDPFDLALSNFVYHAQRPTPESWVKTLDPCGEERWDDGQTLGELVGPALVEGEDAVMTDRDVELLRGTCENIYGNSAEEIKEAVCPPTKAEVRSACKEESKQWSYYSHLHYLDSRRALALATTHIMIQGITGGDILRMANNLVKLKQVQELEDRIRASQQIFPYPRKKMIQVMTLSMSEFTREPYASTLRFLDFALEDAVAPEVKEGIASEYEEAYKKKLREGEKHITADKEILNGRGENIVENKAKLEKFLRSKEPFGRVLGNVERLVQDALRDSGSSIV